MAMAKKAGLILIVLLLAGCQAGALRAQVDALQGQLDYTEQRMGELQNELNQLPEGEPGRAAIEAQLDESRAFLDEMQPYLDRLRERADQATTDEEATVGMLVTIGEGIAAALGFGGVGLAMGSWLRTRRQP
jgi:chromosome segregation ATPase